MTMQEMIFRRKSCRSFASKPVEGELLEKVKSFQPKPLYPDIRVRMEIVDRKNVKCICPWTTPQVIAFYSEQKEGYLENVGFLFQQMDLYLQSLGLGVCWLGLGKMHPKTAPKVKGMQFVIMLAFGYPKGEQVRSDGKGFHRKPLEKIADREDPRLEPARLAPSAVNRQPWYFTHEGDVIHAYCVKNGLGSAMNPLDVGIALAHLYVANADTFQFQKKDHPEMLEYCYICSVNI